MKKLLRFELIALFTSLLVLPMFAHENDRSDSDKGPVAYYPLDGNALDRSGNHNDGALIGGSWTADRFGVQNRALRLQKNGYVEIANDKLLDGAKAAAISGWFYSELNPGEAGFVIGAGDARAGIDPFVLLVTGDGYILQSLFTETPRGPYSADGIIGFNDPKDQVKIKTGAWNSFVMQFASTSTRSIFELYVNGSLARHFEYPYSLTIRFDQAMPVQLGALTGFQNVQFRGAIDDIRFWDHTLNLETIARYSDPNFQESKCGHKRK